MRKSGLVGILFVVLFMLPVTSPNMGSGIDATSLPPLVQYDEGYSVSDIGDLSTGTGLPLGVNIGGVVSNDGEGSMEISSETSGTSYVTIEDGWTGSNLNGAIDTLTMVAEDVLNNGDLDDTHNELFIVTVDTAVNDDPVLLPDGWTLTKNVPNDSPHPTQGAYRLESNAAGYDSTYGIRIGADYPGTFNHVAVEEMYLSQMVSVPWREVYSVTISFRYFVESSSNMFDQVNLFTRIGGVTSEFHVFENGDTEDSWLTASTTIQASSMSDLASYAIQLDIGLTWNGGTGTRDARVRIDDVEADFTVRPFPEQVDLKANGTIVWGSTSGSVYPYVPDDANRDCYDTASSGLDLDGYGDDGGLAVGMYSSSYLMDTQFEAAFQFPVDIPQGAIITSAYFEAEATTGSSPYLPGMRLSVADESNMSAFTSGGDSLEDRYSWLPTSIDWTMNSWIETPITRYRSPEMGSLVQKVISNSNWVSGNYLCVMAELMYATYYQNWNDLKGSSHYDDTQLARLFIEYVIPEDEDTVIFFDYQKDITIDHNMVSATLSDFPVMIELYDKDMKTKVLSDGNDIAFTINGQPVAHEIDLFDQDYNSTDAHLVAWVKVPTLSSSTDTVITMHYGSANAPDSYSGKVWNDYSIVQHLNNDPSGIQYDSTSNNYDGTSYGGLSAADLVDGKIGDAIDFDGSDDHISVGQIFTDDWSQFTISAWVNHDGFYDDRIFSKALDTSVANCIVHLAVDNTGAERIRLSTDGVGGSAATSLDSSANPSNQNWHHLAVSWDASTETVWLYVDGSPDSSYSKDGDSIDDSDLMFIIANWAADQTDTRNWHGLLDEIRMLPTALTDEWIEAEFNNQDDPSSFISVGTETAIADTWTDAGDTRVVFTTSSPTPITLQTYITMDISGEGQTLDESLDPGTSYFIESGRSYVNWTAKVMISPPAGATSFGFSVDYPMAEWKPTTVLNPFNDPKTISQDWWYQGGTLTINASSIDFWGIWTLKFISWNFVDDLTLGKTGETLSTTAVFDIGDSMKFQATTPTVNGATVGFVITDPSGSVIYTGTNTTSTTPGHKFPSFEYRKDFTIAPADVIADVDQFPVAIDITDSDLQNVAKVRSDGSDIMFAQGDIIVPHEIESFEQSSGRFVAWVSANLSASVTTTITMYYGSPVVDNLENPDGVWGSYYDAVWHLGEDVTDESSGGTHYDSTTNNYDGTHNGNSQTASSRVGYAQYFDGDDYITITDTLTPPGDVTITGWFYISSTHDSSSANTQVLMEKFIDADRNMAIALVGQDYGHSSVPDGSLVFKVESATGSARYKWTTRTNWQPGWYYIGVLSDEDNPASNQIFVGTSTIAGMDTDVTDSGSNTQGNMSYVEAWQLGGGDYDSGSVGQGWFTGYLDEWRVSSTLRDENWLWNEWNNQYDTSGFISTGSEQTRSGPDHTFTQTLGAEAAGVWTVSAYYNDTGTYVSTRTGLFERTFTVKRDTTLTLTKPIDAVGDRLSVKTAGDSIIIEFELEDALNSQGIAGATVTMNWTSPATVTLDDYGGGVYGKVLDTDDLVDAKRWRVEVDSIHPYYNDDIEYFDIDLYHTTELDFSVVTTTPVGVDFTTTVTFTDSYTGSPITNAVITFGDDSPVQSFTHEGSGVYSVIIDSNALSIGAHIYTLKATSANSYLNVASTTITFELRAHFTAQSIAGNLVTPYGADTDVTVFLFDLDTGLPLDASVVTSFTFTSSYGTQVETATFNLDAALNTDTWAVGTYIVNLTMIMSDSDYTTPSQFSFSVEIRKHYTSLTVSGVVNQPYGNMTPLIILLIDLDTGGTLSSSIVSNFNFAWLGDDFDYAGGGSLSFNLDTSLWSVGDESVTVTTTMSSPYYEAPAQYVFTITIRSMSTVMYTGPTSFNFTLGSDFTVDLQLNVSEAGQYYADPITGRLAGEFSVPGYAITIDTSQQATGLYTLTISETYFTGGSEEITVYFTSADGEFSNAFIHIEFYYREIVSYLSSPNYPQVTTPYQLDVEILLEYADADFGTGIEGATITSPDHQTWIINQTDLTGGSYSVFIDVSSLAQGTYFISLTADKSGYDAKTLDFRIVIRAAYTSIVPSVGSLDIPIGSSLVFYVNYNDIDRLVPIENTTIPYTAVVSTWTNYTVVYESSNQRYKITFYTSDYDSEISQNIVYNFTFSKGTNYQPASFNLAVSIRSHNTDFRIVSSIEPTSTTGIFNISVYYGDLDDAIGIKSSDVDFYVHNASGLVSSSYDYDIILGDGYYIIQVPGSQFGLGLQTFTVYADWTAVLEKYQDKSFVTSANVVGRISALTLLVAAEPTAYLESMNYTFFFSDSGTGISNISGNVFISVSFQGDVVNPLDVTITDWSTTQPGNYSVDFNTDIFSRIGLIYMDISVEWAKGVAPYYSNRTDTVSVRVLQRETLLQVSPPSPLSFGETASFNFTFDDITGTIDVPINDDIKLTIAMNTAFSYSETGGIFTITIDTTQFGAVGSQSLTLSITWDGAPFYANKTGRAVFLNVINRETYVEYYSPAPTQYLDEVMFNVTWTDITNSANDPITGGTLTLYSDASAVGVGKYSYVEIAPGIYQITLNTTYALAPSTYSLRVDISKGSIGIIDVSVSRDFSIRSRITILSAEPIVSVPYNSTIVVVLHYQDLFTSSVISNESADGFPATFQIIGGDGSEWIYSVTWRPVTSDYLLTIETSNQPYITYTTYTLNLRMSYAYQSPFFASDDLTIDFELRNRQTTLGLTTEAETTPYGDNAIFTVFYGDSDASDAGIAAATIVVLNNSIPLTENTHYILTEGSGFYTITIDSQYLGYLGSYTLEVQASWTGVPYYATASRDVSILVRERETRVEITIAPSQTQYLNDVVFTFVFTDIETDVGISAISVSNIHLYFLGYTEIFGYTVNQVGASVEITINSTILTTVPVSGLSLIIQVDWDDSDAPFYADDETILKVTVTGRSFLVQTDQIPRTPKDDVMVITVRVTDMDNDNPVEGAIILFSSQNESLVEGTHYDKFEAGGVYRFDVYTDQFIGIGILLFDIEVQWASGEPFYSNQTSSTVNGLVDYVRTSLQASAPTPSTVQITGNVSFLVTYHDLDHNLLITGATGAINVEYEGGTPIGGSLLIFETATPGVYNISFSTIGLAGTGIYTIEIDIPSSKYAYVSATPQFTVTLINSALAPLQTSYQVDWTETAFVFVDFMDTFHGYNISGGSIAWYLGGTFGGFMVETATPGQYRADIDTGVAPFGAGTFVLTIRGSATTYSDALTTVTLVILSLPSDIIIIEPTSGVVEVSRGNSVSVAIQLNDTMNNMIIGAVDTIDVYITFQEYAPIALSWNGILSRFEGTLPGYATILDPGSYDVRITATFNNYQPTSEQFKILIHQTETTLEVIGATEVDAVFSELITFTLKLTEDAYNTTVSDATVSWYEQAFDELNQTFTYDPVEGNWILTFNTSQGYYGTWGFTFRAFPNNATLASTTTTVTLTIKKITTEVIAPPISPEVYWGWTGYISFTYYDTSFDEGVVGAGVFYDYGTFTDLPALDLGNGTYLVFINTTYLTPNAQHRILVDFGKVNFEERVGGINIFVNLRPTELSVLVDDARTYETSGDTTILEIPMGDSFDISFLFNDTSLIGGLNGGLEGAGIFGTLIAPSYFTGSSESLSGLGSGFYTFTFDTNNLTLYETNNFTKIVLDGQFFLTVEFTYPNRVTQSITVQIRIIEVPVEIIYTGPTEFDSVHGDILEIEFEFVDTWHESGVGDAIIQFTEGSSAVVSSNVSYNDGRYLVTIHVSGTTGDSIIRLTLVSEFHESINMQITVTANPNDTDLLIAQFTNIGLPISFVIITLLGLYVRVWSVPKRIRQINGQVKSLRKGKVPKPISDVKGRSELIAELFNDTYAKMAITRTAAEMPEDSIPIDVPEMGELLVQLAILTNLDAGELEEFKADIAKMKISEQAAFVKEVIVQEAIRAGRRDDKTVEEVLAEVEKLVRQRLAGDSGDEIVLPDVAKPTKVETVILDPEELSETDEGKGESTEDYMEVQLDSSSETMSEYEIEELHKELENNGIPPHEIDTIVEQARELPRALVEELVRSLEGVKK